MPHFFPRYPALAHAVDEWASEIVRLVRRGGWPLRRHQDASPFFIVSSGRAGTTLLRRLLETHSNVHIPPEMYGFKPAVRRYKRNRFKAWNDLVDLVVSSYDYEPSFGDYNVCLRDLVLHLKRARPEDRSLAMIIGTIYRYHAERVASKTAAIVGDKTPMNVEALDEIFEVFPTARVVHMMRDGIDVVYSMLEMNRYDDLQVAAERWKRSVDIVHDAADRYPGNIITVQYEDLVVRPGDVVKCVCAFLGSTYFEDARVQHDDPSLHDIAKHEHLRNALKPAFTDGVGRGRRSLNAGQRRQLFEMLGPQLRRCGYDAD